jgi:2,3-bisphosphoglycerate-dependent phosphoglycerate mutase
VRGWTVSPDHIFGAKMMSTFYLVRHAHADWTPDEHRPLSARGSADANRVADILQQHPIGAIYASPFRRARQTVQPLAARLGMPVHIEQGLEERRLGSAANEGFLEAVEATWRDPSYAHPGGETNAAAQQRGLSVLRRLQEQHTAKHIVLTTHGNLMALILQGMDASIDFAFWKSLSMPDIYMLNVGQDGKARMNRLWQENN